MYIAEIINIIHTLFVYMYVLYKNAHVGLHVIVPWLIWMFPDLFPQTLAITSSYGLQTKLITDMCPVNIIKL